MEHYMQTAIALIAGSILLALVSRAAAYPVSQIMEAAFDEIECALALRARRQAIRARRAAELAHVATLADDSYVARVGVRL